MSILYTYYIHIIYIVFCLFRVSCLSRVRRLLHFVCFTSFVSLRFTSLDTFRAARIFTKNGLLATCSNKSLIRHKTAWSKAAWDFWRHAIFKRLFKASFVQVAYALGFPKKAALESISEMI